MKVVEALNLEKTYPDGTRALRGVNLSVERGEFVGVMGPSGSGKSTLLHLLGGLDKPTKGKIILFGREIQNLPEDELAKFRRQRVAYIFQFYYLLEDFTVLENLTVVGEIAGVKEPKAKALELLKFLRLTHRINHKPHQLSGGEQQRVAIGRALITNPKLILADEPTGNLDSAEGERIFRLFHELNKKGITFIVATHNENLVPFFSRVLRIRDGKLIEPP
ncbi:MAG: ABC transporter ATP-binding protein [Aquificae bacterium]|nr:ABC transporter ATP-binding protein [Aquificota bacterium]